MDGKRVVKHASLALGACAATVLLAATPSWAATLTVNDDATGAGPSGATCNVASQYETIQEAITAANPTDTINVCAGTYAERPVVDKTLTINGAQAGNDASDGDREGGTATSESIVGNGESNNVIFSITAAADAVTLDGFTIRPTSGATSTDVVGVQPAGDDYEVVNNVVTDNTIGLYPGGTGGLIGGNHVVDNNRAGDVSGSGIYTDSLTTDLVVASNLFEDHDNVSMNFASTADTGHTGLQVTDNDIEGNRILLTKTTDSEISGNTITNSLRSGVQIDFNNQGLTVEDNTITDTAATFPAVRLTSVNDATAPASNNIAVTGNDLSENDIGVQVQADNKTPDGGLTVNQNRIFDNSVAGIQNNSAFDVSADNNWWGCNEGPNEDGCDTTTDTGTGETDVSEWLVLAVKANPASIRPNQASTITARLLLDTGEGAVARLFPDSPVEFSAVRGMVRPTSVDTTNGSAVARLTTNSRQKPAIVTTTLDNESVRTVVRIRR